MWTPLVTGHQPEVNTFTVVSFYCPPHFWAASAPGGLTSTQFVKPWHAILLLITGNCLSLVLSVFPFQSSLKFCQWALVAPMLKSFLPFEKCTPCPIGECMRVILHSSCCKRQIYAFCSHFNVCVLWYFADNKKKIKSKHQI